VVLCGGCVRSPEETLLCALDSEGRCNLFDVIDHQDSDIHSGGEHDGSYAVCLSLYILLFAQWAKSPKKQSEEVHFCQFGTQITVPFCQKYTPTRKIALNSLRQLLYRIGKGKL